MPILRRLTVQHAWLVTLLACDYETVSSPDARHITRALSEADSGTITASSARIWPAGGAGTFPSNVSYTTETGVITTVNRSGPTETSQHAFFTPLGSNGRACITCHQPADGMSISSRTASQLWEETRGEHALFAMIDGANCPNLPASERSSHSLLLERGLFRIALPWPPLTADGTPIEPEFSLEVVRDPTGCNLDATWGLLSEQPRISVYRRPRPAANLKYATEIGFSFDPKNGLPLALDRDTGKPTSGNLLADARLHTLSAQAIDALRTHAGLVGAPGPAQLQQILDFETQLFTAQSSDARAGELTAAGAQGGPEALAQAPAAQLQSSTANPIWGEFAAWKEQALPAPADGHIDAEREFRVSVARGATLFASRQFLVSDSTGINDTGFGNPVRNSCAFCHNMLHAGLDVAPGQVDLGTANIPFANRLPELPLFRLTCRSTAPEQPYLGRVVYTHDPGYALTTGKCIDIGKITAQSLRGIAARAPYFSNGSARTLAEVIDFYDRRYAIQLTDQEKLDLQHLLEVL
jgi:hypothetical protein